MADVLEGLLKEAIPHEKKRKEVIAQLERMSLRDRDEIVRIILEKQEKPGARRASDHADAASYRQWLAADPERPELSEVVMPERKRRPEPYIPAGYLEVGGTLLRGGALRPFGSSRLRNSVSTTHKAHEERLLLREIVRGFLQGDELRFDVRGVRAVKGQAVALEWSPWQVVLVRELCRARRNLDEMQSRAAKRTLAAYGISAPATKFELCRCDSNTTRVRFLNDRTAFPDWVVTVPSSQVTYSHCARPLNVRASAELALSAASAIEVSRFLTETRDNEVVVTRCHSPPSWSHRSPGSWIRVGEPDDHFA